MDHTFLLGLYLERLGTSLLIWCLWNLSDKVGNSHLYRYSVLGFVPSIPFIMGTTLMFLFHSFLSLRAWLLFSFFFALLAQKCLWLAWSQSARISYSAYFPVWPCFLLIPFVCLSHFQTLSAKASLDFSHTEKLYIMSKDIEHYQVLWQNKQLWMRKVSVSSMNISIWCRLNKILCHARWGSPVDVFQLILFEQFQVNDMMSSILLLSVPWQGGVTRSLHIWVANSSFNPYQLWASGLKVNEVFIHMYHV